MNQELYPILEFDPDNSAFIEPHKLLQPIDIPRRCVLCFFQDVLQKLHADGQLKVIFKLGSEIGQNLVYEMEVEGERVTVLHPGVGAPLAGAFLEELIALGCRDFIACGGCGVLDGTIGLGHVVVPATAVRDEGTSYHYLPPSREVTAHPNAVQAIEQALQKTPRSLYHRQNVDNRRHLSGDAHAHRPAPRRRLPRGRNGSRCLLCRGSISQRHLRPIALRWR